MKRGKTILFCRMQRALLQNASIDPLRDEFLSEFSQEQADELMAEFGNRLQSQINVLTERIRSKDPMGEN